MREMIIFTLLLIFNPLFAQQQNQIQDQRSDITSIEDIVSNPGEFSNEFVIVEGHVTQYTPGDEETTANYLLVGDYGTPIKVNTQGERPNISTPYRVMGTVVIDPYTQQPYIIENKKEALTGDDNILLYGILIGGFVLIAVLLVILLRRKSEPETPPAQEPQSEPNENYQSESYGDPAPDTDYEEDFKTIRISTDSPKTFKFIPGKLVITTGEDTGKEFMIPGYPTPEGNIVTVGREDVKGERRYAHIQLKERTVSRKQAELIQKDGKLFIKNLSETNYTQLNGTELEPGELKEIKDKSTLRFGELEFQYNQ